jgi:hypothetical protein
MRSQIDDVPRRTYILGFILSFWLLGFHQLGSVGLLLRNAVARRFGRRKLLFFCLQ